MQQQKFTRKTVTETRTTTLITGGCTGREFKMRSFKICTYSDFLNFR